MQENQIYDFVMKKPIKPNESINQQASPANYGKRGNSIGARVENKNSQNMGMSDIKSMITQLERPGSKSREMNKYYYL